MHNIKGYRLFTESSTEHSFLPQSDFEDHFIELLDIGYRISEFDVRYAKINVSDNVSGVLDLSNFPKKDHYPHYTIRLSRGCGNDHKLERLKNYISDIEIFYNSISRIKKIFNAIHIGYDLSENLDHEYNFCLYIASNDITTPPKNESLFVLVEDIGRKILGDRHKAHLRHKLNFDIKDDHIIMSGKITHSQFKSLMEFLLKPTTWRRVQFQYEVLQATQNDYIIKITV